MSNRFKLIAILLVAFALRLYGLERTIWYDEAFSIFLAERELVEIVRGTAADIQPPLYYVLLHFWLWLGDAPFVARFLSVVFSMPSVALCYTLARRWFSTRVGEFAALLVAVAPFQVSYAQELRMYTLLSFMLLLYVYAFARLVQGDLRWRNVWLMVFAGASALYSQSLAALTWLVPGVFMLGAFLRRQVDREIVKRALIGHFVGFALFVPWLGILSAQVGSVQQAYWVSAPGLIEFLQLMLAFTTYQPLPGWFLPIALFITLAFDALLALEIARAVRRGSNDKIGLPLVCVVFPPLALITLSYLVRPLFITRAVIFSALAFALLIGWWLARSPRVVAQVALTIWLVMVAVALAFQYQYAEFPRSPFRAADEFLRARVQPGDLIVHDNKLSFFPMRFYDRALSQEWIADPPNAGSNTLSIETMRVLRVVPIQVSEVDGARVWFVIFQRAIDEPYAGGQSPANLVWLQARYQQTDVERFNDLNIFRFEK